MIRFLRRNSWTRANVNTAITFFPHATSFVIAYFSLHSRIQKGKKHVFLPFVQLLKGGKKEDEFNFDRDQQSIRSIDNSTPIQRSLNNFQSFENLKMEATKEEKKREREERERSNSISLILLATSTITLLLHRYISFPFTGCAPVIPFTDPLCSSFPSRNIGFIFPIKIHRNTCIFFPFFPSMVQLSVSYRGRERGAVGIGVEKNTNPLLESR